MLNEYFKKMKGEAKSPPAVSLTEIALSWIGAFSGIALVAYLHFNILSKTDLSLIVGSFGASAVLIYGAVKSPLAQPRNLLGGHIFSAVIGVASYQLFSPHIWFAAAMA